MEIKFSEIGHVFVERGSASRDGRHRCDSRARHCAVQPRPPADARQGFEVVPLRRLRTSSRAEDLAEFLQPQYARLCFSPEVPS